MDSKNVIAAISLSAAVIILYGLFFAPEPQLINQAQQEKNNIVENSEAPKLIDTQEINTTHNRALVFCLLIALPSAAGLYILSSPIIYILFERGAFLPEDTFYTAKVLSIFALGLPAYILIKVLVTCFFAREDTKTPLYISVISVIINIVLSLLLIGTMREMGIALATAISSWVNAVLLFFILRIQKNILLDSRFINSSFKIIISAIVMSVGCYFINQMIFSNLQDFNSLLQIVSLIFVIICCKIIYLAMIFMLKVLTVQELKGYIQNKV